jgi:hypothetical protein
MAQDAIDQFIALPKEERGKLFEQLAPEKQHALLGKIKERKSAKGATPSFTVAGEGTYDMSSPEGKVVPVSYSQVGAASQAKYRMRPEHIRRYVTDAAADPNLNKGVSLPEGVKVVGRNAAGQPIYGPAGAPPPEGSAAHRFLSSAGAAIGGAAKGMYQGVVQGPQNPDEAAIVAQFAGDPLKARAALIAHRMVVRPAIEQGQQAASEFQQMQAAKPWTSPRPSPTAVEHGRKALGHALAAALPGVGPWAAQVGEQVGTQVGTGDIAGAGGTLAGNVALYAAPHLLGKAGGAAVKGGKAAIRSAAEAMTETGPRQLRQMAQETAQANADAVAKAELENKENAEKHLEKTKEAIHETRGREIGYEAEVKAKEQELRAEHQADIAKVRAENARIKAKHQADIAKVQTENDRVKAKHQAISDRIAKENEATDHALELRRAEETRLEQDTGNYYAKEDATKANAKAAADAKWKPWHEKIAKVTVDGGEIAEPLKKITAVSPEVTRMLHQLVPDPSEAAPDSLFAQDRQAVMQSQGYKGSYWELPPDKRALVDQITASSGFEPEPIDFDPQRGVAIPAEQVHRAKSIVGRNVASGRYEGPLLGEMKQLLKVLDQAETRASMKAGALDDLKAGRTATREYQEAFGRDRHIPKTQDEIRKQQANPEQWKEENDQERLDAAKKFDPSLAEDYAKVKALRDRLKKMPTEDQLRKGRKQIPPAPTVGDLREGYRLEPPPPPPTVGDLREGYRLKPEPTPPAPAKEIVSLWDRAEHPDRPKEVPAEKREIGAEDIQKERTQKIKTFVESLRRQGIRRTVNSAFYTVPLAITSFVLKHGGLGALELASAPAILTGSESVARLLEKPEVQSWLSKITPKDVAMWEKLPPEQKAVFSEELKPIVQAAAAKRFPVASSLVRFVGAATAAPQAAKSLRQLREEAEKRRPSAALVPTEQTAAGGEAQP